MAKKSAIQRNLKRERMIAKYAAKRKELKAILTNPETPDEEFYKAQAKLTKLPKNSSLIRARNRCSVTGRPRAPSFVNLAFLASRSANLPPKARYLALQNLHGNLFIAPKFEGRF